MRHVVPSSRPESRNSSAELKAIAECPNELSRSTVALLTRGSSSTIEIMTGARHTCEPKGAVAALWGPEALIIPHSGDVGQVSEGICGLSVGFMVRKEERPHSRGRLVVCVCLPVGGMGCQRAAQKITDQRCPFNNLG